MKKILSKTPVWSQLKWLGNSKTIKSSYIWLFLVPILSKLFSSLNSIIEIKLFDATWSLNMALPFNLKMFYFSAVSFAIASIIYKIWCPAGIDKYETFEEYKEKGKSLESLISSMWFACNAKKFQWPFELRPRLLRRFIRDFTNYSGDIRKIDLSKGMPIKIKNTGIKEGKEKAAYFLVADTWNATSPVVRFVCSWFYFIGILFFSIILIENFMYVISFM